MTAKEMFEKLGYEQADRYIYRHMIVNRTIIFRDVTRRIDIRTLFVNDVSDLNLSKGEEEAIKQQMKELGWIR